MKQISFFLKNTLVVLLLLVSAFATGQTGKLPNVVILATGGTIAGAAKTGAQAGYTSGQVNIDAMIDAIPEVKKIANIKGEQVSNVGSRICPLRSCCNWLKKFRNTQPEKTWMAS